MTQKIEHDATPIRAMFVMNPRLRPIFDDFFDDVQAIRKEITPDEAMTFLFAVLSTKPIEKALFGDCADRSTAPIVMATNKCLKRIEECWKT